MLSVSTSADAEIALFSNSEDNDVENTNADVIPSTLQQSFLTYKDHTLGVSVQYPSDWRIHERSDDKLNFIKQEGFVTADLNVEDLEQTDTTLSKYANTKINELQEQRPGFQLVGFEPTTVSNNMPAQKVVYTFEREEDGKINKVMRIWSINEGKLYTLAYIAESSQYDRYLPSFQKMVDSFNLDAGGTNTDSSITQIQSSSNEYPETKETKIIAELDIDKTGKGDNNNQNDNNENEYDDGIDPEDDNNYTPGGVDNNYDGIDDPPCTNCDGPTPPSIPPREGDEQ
jgi:hypothetical protein